MIPMKNLTIEGDKRDSRFVYRIKFNPKFSNVDKIKPVLIS